MTAVPATDYETEWRLTDKAHRLFAEGDIRVFSTDMDITQWDGRWLIVNVPIPESRRTARKKLYAALHWAGFGNPIPGLWVTARLADALRLRRNTVNAARSSAASSKATASPTNSSPNWSTCTAPAASRYTLHNH